MVDFLPAPNEVKAVSGILDNEEEGSRESNDDEPFSGIAFKIATDPFVGSLTFVRVYSGTLNTGDSVYLPIKGKKERIGRMLQMHSNKREEIINGVQSNTALIRHEMASLVKHSVMKRIKLL